MIHIRVKLFAILKKYAPIEGLPGTPFQVDLPELSTLHDLSILLKMPEEEVKIAFINGIIKEMDCILNDNDEVGMFPPIGGG